MRKRLSSYLSLTFRFHKLLTLFLGFKLSKLITKNNYFLNKLTNYKNNVNTNSIHYFRNFCLKCTLFKNLDF